MSADPLSDDDTAYRLAALPLEYGSARINQLFSRGYSRYVVDGEQQPADLLADVERFGVDSFKQQVRHDATEDPYVDEPATLAVLATLSAICVKAHPQFESTPPWSIQVLYDIRELFVNNLASLIRTRGDETLLQDIAEVLYRKPPSEDGPHPGRVCTGIRRLEAFDGGVYIEIPMAAASRHCLVRDADEEIQTHIKENHLYIPAGDFDDKYRSYAEQAFKKLLTVHEDGLSADQHTWLTTNESGISERIDRFVETGNHDRIWHNWNPGDRTVGILRQALGATFETDVSLGGYHTATQLFEILDDYAPDAQWEQSITQSISSPSSLANRLTRHEDHPGIRIDRDGRINRYRIGSSGSGAERIDVQQLDDLFELPCMANMKERLHEKKPVRKDLYNFVRMVMWLPQYQESSFDEIVADLKGVFSKWPWYDEQVTDYQIRYEFSNTINGDTPLPMNCNNDDIQRYCIGQDQCPYSIWGSLPFPDEMYDQLDETESTTSEF